MTVKFLKILTEGYGFLKLQHSNKKFIYIRKTLSCRLHIIIVKIPKNCSWVWKKKKGIFMKMKKKLWRKYSQVRKKKKLTFFNQNNNHNIFNRNFTSFHLESEEFCFEMPSQSILEIGLCSSCCYAHITGHCSWPDYVFMGVPWGFWDIAIDFGKSQVHEEVCPRIKFAQ